MFTKILIANRGEIAVRVARCCRELGIPTVAVYSDADRESLHVRYADEAYPIGPPPAAESYLDMDAILGVATRTGADAVHPGYGFLSENAEFARRVARAGLTFIGPSPEAMAMMGDKAEARRVAQKAGLPTVPGSSALRTEREAEEEADRIGYPLLVKAAGGGGGRGMRVVTSPSELLPALREARSEASASFGDPTVYLERYIERPRHVEFQILGDGGGAVVHLLERECSIQRRHQKLVEESPSVRLDGTLRREMGEAAVSLARASHYTNAGTVEFLVDERGRFYFLEMNARLQVEHPVTECITGFDLVRLQLGIAAGERLSFRQEDVNPRGWAMEFRITAEDPFHDFVPCAGVLRRLRPAGGPGVRDDSGVYAGWRVTPFYDSLLAKLIVWAEDRKACLARASRALTEYRAGGIATTLPFHRRLVSHEGFAVGDFDTGWVAREWPLLSEVRDARAERAALAAAAVSVYRKRRAAALSTPDGGARDAESSWRAWGLRDQLGSRL
jgi:acetyl-CoA carboxylase biotin carboxylase subunit